MGRGINVFINNLCHMTKMAAMPIYGKNPSKIIRGQWPSGRALDSKSRGPGFEPHKGHPVVSMSKTH